MMKALYIILFLAAVITACVKYMESRGIFFPDKEIGFYPSAGKIPFEDVYVETDDGVKVNGWFMPYSNAKYTILFFHGNAGNIAHRLEKLIILRDTGANIFIIDYRGYGKSTGRACEKGLYLDARAAYRYLVDSRGIPLEQIILYGESLGTAVAIDLAARVAVKAVIVEGAFSRGKDMAGRIYPFLPGFLFSNSFDSLEKIKNVRAPKLFIHSGNDEIVPFALAAKLYHASAQPKELIEISGGHNTAFLDSQAKYISSIASFLERLSAGNG